MGIVLITGLPGSGKSTLAGPLATALGLPIIAKDRLKEILFEALGVHDVAWARQIGQAAIALQYEMMRITKSAVVDSALWTDRSEAELEALKLPMVQVYCECPFEVARHRFFRRHKDATRHEGFRDDSMTVEDFEAFRPLTEPLRLSCPLLRLDTAEPVDAAEVASAVRALLQEIVGTNTRRPLVAGPTIEVSAPHTASGVATVTGKGGSAHNPVPGAPSS